MRRIIGNLDFETQLAVKRASSREGPSSSGRRPAALPSVSPSALETISSLATLLRVLAEDGDHLWTPRPVDPTRVDDVPGLPRPVLESGPSDLLEPADSLLAWGETTETASQRARGQKTEPESEGHRASGIQRSRSSHPIAAWLWSYPPPSPTVVAKVNHRSFHLELARRLGHALPGARVLHSFAELKHHLADGGAAASPSGEWVLKAPLSAAGRERVRGSERNLGTQRVQSHAENLFARYGSLLFEPWLDRLEDFGCCALLDEHECRIVSLHRQEVDGYGRMKSLELQGRSTGFPGLSGLTERERRTIETVVNDVGRELTAVGYRGPFGIDGWRHRDADGQEMFHALGEINARMSFGLLARVLIDRLEPPFASGAADRWIVRFGSLDTWRGAAGRRTASLVSPADNAGGAWIEMPEPLS